MAHYEYISWEYWSVEEIEFFSNWCWSSRWIFRPPYARQYSNICNRHDIRYLCWGSIFDKLWADFILFIEMFFSSFTYFEKFWLWNIGRVILAFIYFVWVWILWTIIDYIAFTFLWKNPAFNFWQKRTRAEVINLYFKNKKTKNEQ